MLVETLERRELLAAEIQGLALPPLAPPPSTSWQPLGPFAATDGQIENVVPNDEVVGALHTVLAHPNDADTLYVGGTNGGIWKTTNATSLRPNWTPLTDDLPSQSIGAMIFDRADLTFQTIYAGNGRYSSFGRLGGQRAGLLATTDGGATWNVIDGGGVLRGKNISGVYANGNTIVVSVNTADNFNPNNVGIFRSTDGGTTFSQVSQADGSGPAGLPAGVSYDLFADPLNANVLYTSMVFSTALGGGQVGVYKSFDQGASWAKVSNAAMDALIDDGITNPTGTSNIEIAVGRADNVYVAIINAGRVDGLFRSGNGGASWIQMDTPSTNENGTAFGLNPGGGKGPGPGSPPDAIAGGQGTIHFSLLADPFDPFVVYAGGDRQPFATEGGGAGAFWPNSIGANDFSGRLFRGDASRPSGGQWVHLTHNNSLGAIGGGTANSSAPHADSREMVFDANGNIIEVDDGGIYRRTQPSSNLGDWFSVIGDLQVTEAHDVAYDSISDVAITGNQDTGTTQQPFAGATIWESVSTADGGDVVVDDISGVALGQSIRYSSFQNLGAFRKRTYDASGTLISQTFPALQVTAGQPFQGAFRTPVELNELNPNRLIIQGANALYESPDQGETLREIPVAGNAFTGNANFLQNAIAVGGELNGLVNPDLLWAASGNNVFVRTTAGGQLNQVNTAPPVTTILDLAIDPDDGNSVFINDNNDVLVSIDAGNSWTNVTGDLLSQASTVWSLSYVDGPFVDAILAGTSLGVFASAVETLGSWIPLGDNLPNVPVYDMEFDDTDNVLVAGTLGRGAWLLDDPIELINEAFVVGREPKLIAVAPNRGDLFDLDPSDQFENLRFQSLTELVLTFGGPNSIDPTTLGAITVEYSESGNFALDARPVEIGHRGLDDSGRNVTIRFAENLEDGFFQLSVSSALTSELGIPFSPNFPEPVPGDPDLVREVISYEIELGAKVVAVVPNPVVGGVPQPTQIEVYYDDIDLFRPGSTVTTRNFYQLVSTRNSVTTEDDFSAIPIGVVDDPTNRKVTLTFAAALDTYVSQGESLRLRIGDSVNFSALRVTDHVAAAEPGLTAASAETLPAAASGSWSVTVDERISNVGLVSLVDNPGGTDEPGHRDIEVEDHLLLAGDRDGDDAITTEAYTFLRNTPYATNSQGDPLFNQMNADQEDRFLEILDIYSSLLGIDFYETESSGLALIVGDLSTADPTISSGPGGVAGLGGPGRVTMDALDFQNAASNLFGGSFFNVALHEIGHAIKLGHSYELPPGTIMGSEGEYPDTVRPGPGTEWAFPGDQDVVHGRYLHQREALDVDLYRVDISEPGILNAQTIAQRLPDASLLDTRLSMFVQDSLGKLELLSANDDYFGSDSFVGFNVEPGTYFIGVSAEGNALYDVNNNKTSAGGTSEGAYELRVDFTSTFDLAIQDADGSFLDGDRDGFAGGNYNFWFEPIDSTTVYVNKDAGLGGDGSLGSPFENIPDALAEAQTRVATAGVEGVVVRLLPSAGADGRVDTTGDNIAYEVGIVASLNDILDDGRNLTLPAGVHLVVDAGVIMKFLDSRISVGSDDDGDDRSEGTISVQGTPQLPVHFTSYNDRTLAINSNVLGTPATPGDWGGIEIRNDVDRAQGRVDIERLGIFQNYVNHAEFSFGGGEVTTINRVIDPIHLSQARAEISYNTITTSSDAAISADPNTFQVTTFSEPRFQASTVTGDGFVSDYSRVGPSIFGNTLTDNSTNGMFVRIDTPPGGGLEKLTVPARFDDTDIVHVLGENLLLEGAAGGPIEDSTRPAPIIGIIEVGGGALVAGDYRYSYTEVDPFGFESPGSTPQLIAGVAAGSQINLTDIPAATGKYVARRLYRSFDDGSGPSAYELVAELDKSSQDYTDNLTTPESYAPELNVLDEAIRHGRVDGSLIVDPGTIIKNQGARIELGFGATLLAEGLDGKEIIFTGRSDDEYGAGGTFDTNGDGPSTGSPAEWAGFYASPTSRLSIDRALIAYGGGVTGVNGGTAFFNPIQIHQADARIANTEFLDNEAGFGASQLNSRSDYAPNDAATIYVTSAQPIIVGSTFIDNRGAAIDINVNSLNAEFRQDLGRQTGLVDRFDVPPGNTGPTIRGNQLGENDVNGMVVRGEVLTTEVVFDDTDIVHILPDDIEIPDLHTYGGMRLESAAAESLVVKFDGSEILATGRALDITDRIGGRLHVLGQPGFPVVMTSIRDCTVGAGFTPDGQPNLDTLSEGACGVQTTAEVPYADIIVVMDESGTMAGTQAFSAQFILDLETALVAAGVGVTDTNRYGAVGFGGGGADNLGHSILVGGGLFGTANEYVTASTQFVTSGFAEDGFSGINFALQNYTFRPEAAKFIILATDEPRSVEDANLSQAGIIADLQAAGVRLQGILDANIIDGNNQIALAIDNTNVYTESGTTFTISPGGTITGGSSVADYVPLVQATNGVTGDLGQIGVSTQTANIFSRVLSSSILGQVSVANPSSAGDWQGLKFDAYSHDRNLAVHTEREGSIAGFGDENAEVGSDENVGRLASEEKTGDENIRLGFTIHGSIADPSDRDMYSFEGEAGTMVWFDIDQTDPQLDTVLELIDGDGRVLALSQDSRTESSTGQLTFVNSALLRDGHALPMQLDHDPELNRNGEYRDLFSLNDGDSGMRVVLPGSAGTRTTFYVRVRSNGPLLNFNTLTDIENTLPLGGSTQGGYRLQLRLQETDDYAGSVVRYADIRYATKAIVAEGLPAHSPIAGELLNPGGTVDIGTFANTDRGAISVTGNASSVDSYQFNVERDSLQGIDPTDNSQSIVIDVDWADGLTRPNTNAYLFDGDVLIAVGTDSNVADDRITPIVPGQPTTAKDLSRGSLGVRDAFIGPLELSPDGNYQVIIANDSQMIGAMTQFTQSNPANTNARLEPIDPTVRVVDDRFDFEPGGDTPVGEPTEIPEALQIAFEDDGSNVIPWQFGDVPLISISRGGRVNIFNPFTGRHDAVVTSGGPAIGAAAQNPRNLLLAIERPTGGQSDANTDTIYSVGPDGTFTNIGATGIETYEYWNNGDTDPATNSNRRAPGGVDGVPFTALAYYNDSNGGNSYLYGLASRPTFTGSIVGLDGNGNEIISNQTRTVSPNNVIFRLDPNTGAAQSRNNTPMPAGFQSASPLDFRLSNPPQNNLNNPPETPWTGTNAIAQVQVPTTKSSTGALTGNVTSLVTDITGTQALYAFTDTGSVWRFSLTEGSGGGYASGDLVVPVVPDIGEPTGFRPADSNLFIDTTIGQGIVDANGNTLIFDEVTQGPSNFTDINDTVGISDLYFGLEAGTDRLYAFTMGPGGGVAQPVFEFGASVLPLDTGLAGGSPAGLFFSPLDQALWHASDTLSSAAGHGMGQLDDRAPVIGGGSLRFGFDAVNDDHSHLEPLGTFGPAHADDLQGYSGYNFLGGAHGAVQSNLLDLSGFSADDLPMLYFTYLLDSEGRNANSTGVMQDSLRVSVAGQDGRWTLVATNNFADGINGRVWDHGLDGIDHEYEPGPSVGYTNVFNQRFVQELFDDDVFRQARIDLGPWAGQEDVQIRFDFSTAGETRPDQTEIQALPGDQLTDGLTLVVTGQMPDRTSDLQGDILNILSKQFEFDLGLVVQMPAGRHVTSPIALTRPDTSKIVELVPGPAGAGQVSVSPFDTAEDVADKVAAFIGASALRSTAHPQWVGFSAEPPSGSYGFGVLGNFIVSQPGVAPTAIPITVNIAMTEIEVRDQIQTALANEIHYADVVPSLAAFPVVGDTSAVRVYDLAVTQTVAQNVVSLPGNDTIATAQGLDAEQWTLDFDPIIENSTSRPHLTIQGQGDGTFDYFSFTADAGAVATFDMDNTTFDTELHLYDSLGNLLATDDDDNANIAPGDMGSAGILDAFLQYTFTAPGTYIIGVGAFDSVGATGGIIGAQVPVGGAYQLHVSVDGKPVTSVAPFRPLTIISGEDAAGSNMPGSDFGVYTGDTSLGGLVTAGGRSRGLGGANGVYIDDIVIGLADRGESVTGAGGSALTANPYFEALFFDPLAGEARPVVEEVTSGTYQLELRLGREYLGDDNAGKDARIAINERLADAFNISVDSRGSSLVDGDTFEISNGFETVRFEFNDVTVAGLTTPVLPGNFAVNYRISDTVGIVADSVRNAINNPSVRAVLGIEATSRGGELRVPTDPIILLHGYAAADNRGGTTFISPESGLSHLSGIITGQNVVLAEDNGDRNKLRDQGQFIVDSNIISFSSSEAIDIGAAPRQPGNKVPDEGDRPKPGAVQSFPTINNDNLIHGAVVQNNLLISNGAGILLSGDTSVGAPNTYSLVLNNTIYNSGVGINIVDNASPTLLNNVLMNNNIGIRGQNEGPTVIRGSVYQDNGTDVNGVVLGTEAIIDSPDPLFVNPDASNFNPAGGFPNFYPAAGSALIDSSIESQLDRPGIVAVKDSVGIPASPAIVTELDLAGQIRRDAGGSSGQGNNINIDRGALDRSDITGPEALLAVPTDNDNFGIDIDPRDTFLHLSRGTYKFFDVLISEESGIGPDSSTITADQVSVLENGRKLTPDVEVIIAYNPANRMLRVQSTSGLWRPDAVYEIVLLNRPFVRPDLTIIDPISDLAGNPIQANRANGSTRFTIIMKDVELDYGDAPDTYSTSFASNGARHAIINAASPRFGRYVDAEVDSLVVGGDDDPAIVTAVGNVREAGNGPFTIAGSPIVNVTLNTLPAPGDNISVTAAGETVIFELIEGGGPITVGRIAVDYPLGADVAGIMDRLAEVMQATLLARNVPAVVQHTLGTDTLDLIGQDDEDGMGIDTFTFMGSPLEGLFVDPVTGEFLSFLNPQAVDGAELVVNTIGDGMLDAWVDFNGDGDFDANEQILTNELVFNGENRLQIFTPPSPAALVNGKAITWARFRLNNTGDQDPDGPSIGGEVEDYRVFIADTPLPEPVNDQYTIDEDITTLLTASIGDNDLITTLVPTPADIRYVLESGTGFGTLNLDPLTGQFTYDPDEDFYGPDSFTYRITGTQVVDGMTLPVRSSQIGTVSLTVTPINDPPFAENHSFVTTEPSDTNPAPLTAITITATELLTGALPQDDAALRQPPWDEFEQTVKVVQVTVTDVNGAPLPLVPFAVPSDPTTPMDGIYTETNYIFSDLSGTFMEAGIVQVTVLGNQVSQIVYQPADDYNENNPPAVGGGPSIDQFIYTVADDGRTTLPDGTLAIPQPAPETFDATISVQVRPQNDPPTANDDIIDSNTFPGTPLQEEVSFVIPRAHILSNDFAGQDPDDDESRGDTVSLVVAQGATTSFSIGPINSGIGVDDNATGTGYIMFSQQDVFSRFVAAPPTNTLNAINSDHLVAVRFNGFTWQYNNDVAWVPFVPEIDDRLLASVNFDFDTITDLQYAFGSVNGIEQGYVIGDLIFEANVFDGVSNVGEFTVSGSFFEVSADPAFPTGFRPFPLTTAQGGTVELNTDGDLVYTSAVDYYGPDSFEYFIVDQGVDVDINGVQTPNFKYAGATVLLNVDPVNDAPGAVNQGFVTPEDTAITISKAELVAGSVGHASPVLGFPFDESNQDDPNTNVVELNIGGVSVTAANASAAPFPTANGIVEAVNFDTNGFLIDLVYRPAPDFNADNPLGNGARRIDSFGFTVADNGVAVLPQGGMGGSTGLASLPLNLIDAAGLEWDIFPDGAIGDGSNDAYDGGMQNTSFAFGPGIVPTEEDGREVVLGPQPAGLLDLVRKVYVPDDDNFARFLEIYTNTNAFPVSHTVTIQTNLGSDSNTVVVDTSSGDQAVAINDDWIVTDDLSVSTGDPAVGHVIRGSGASITPSTFTAPTGFVSYSYQLTLNPGETQILMSYGIQNFDRPTAVAQAQTLVSPSGAAIRGMSPAELQSVVNFDLSGFVPPQTTFQNPPATTTATAFILVTPQNDDPVLGDDLITSSDPIWNSFSSADPTEDTTLVIPAAFLFDNDTNAPPTAMDELNETNDSSALSLVPINFTTTLGGTVTVLPNGDLSYQPPADVFGLDTFEYAAIDQGIDEDIFFNRVVNSLESRATVSILIDPVNDPPQSFDRFLFEVEDTLITFDADDLLNELPVALPSNSSPLPIAPYDENEQSLRVVAFSDADESIDVNSLVNPSTGNDGDGTLTMRTVSGGTLTFNFLDGAFVDGSYLPGPNYNQRTPFAAVELFSYVVADDGITTIPDSGIVDGTGVDTIVDLPDQRSQRADVTITVTPVNDAPIFEFMPVVDILERDDRAVTVVGGWASNISPGPLTALDELQRETVSFTYVPSLSTVPAGLFRVDPQFDPNGALSVFPNPDQIGTAEIVVQVQDVDNVSGSFTPIFSQVTFTLNIRPLNDPPRINPAVLNTGDTLSADQAYAVDSSGVLTLTMTEDNTGSGGTTSPFIIPMTTQSGPGYTPPGLLDLFEVGPANEIAPPAEPGGSQFLELFDFPSQTALGGQLTEVTDASGAVVSLSYTPPADYNNTIGAFDSFTYVVIDKSATGDESYSLIDRELVPDRLTATNRVLIDLTAVNDRPVFDVSATELEVAEDSPLQRVGGYAINFAAGPVGTASDENDLINGQVITFAVTATNVSSPITDFFTVPPTITSAGVLEYQAAPDVFGQFEFDIVLMDDGASDLARGDINVSLPTQLTINVRPINDAPVIDPAAVGSLDFSTREDQPIDISASAATVAGDLLGAFNPGPSNESSNTTPGGNQTLVIDSATFPTSTDEGGTLTPVTDGNGTLTHYRYQPRSNFVGMDSFIYTVVDDGTTVGVDTGGQVTADPQTTIVTITVEVLPVNDAPVLTGGGDVTVDEDSGLVTITDWATAVQPGPADADDELVGSTAQQVSIDIALLTGDPGLFTTPPSVSLSGNVATLSFQPAPNANGSAVFAATLTDDGPSDAGNGDENTTVQNFTITVDSLNDPPTFDPGADVTVPEDSAAYNQPWATNISPGPAEEATSQTIDRFEVIVPTDSAGLFSEAPAISADGTLTFTPAADASGNVDLEVTAIDSLGGRSATVILPISITESDDSPVPQDDFIDADEDNVLTIDVVDILANDFDPDLLTNPAETLSVNSVASLSLQGALVTFDATTGEITYDPSTSDALQALSTGQLEDRFTYTVVDADGETTPPTATVILNVQGLNDAPVVADDNPFVLINSSTVLDILGNDDDVDGTIDPTSIVITLQPSAGALSIDPAGTLTYVTQPGFEGNDVFRYTVADNLGQQSRQATVTVRVGVAPQANDDVSGTFLENPVDINVLGNDQGDLDPATVVVETPPTNGQAIPQADGTIRYTPNDGFLGTDSFTYSVADVDGRRSAAANVGLRVVESNLQNPKDFFDVNASGEVTGLDALLIINRIAQAGGAINIPVDPDARGPNFYDVDGNGTISGLDALLVINQLAQQQLAGEAELVQAIAPQTHIVSHSDSSLQPVSTIEQATDKVVGSSQVVPEVSGEVIDLIVEGADDDKSVTEAVDAVLATLG